MNVKKSLTRLGFLVSLFFLTKSSILAQSAGSYVFTKTNGNFMPLGALTSIVSGDDAMSTTQPIGFTFNYAGNNYTSFKVSTNGFINLGGNLTGSLATNQLNSTTNTPIIAPLWDDLVSTVVAEVSGTPGNQVLTVEWRNVEWRYTATTAGFTFQAKLYEADGKIEFIYGDSTNASSGPSASIGINSAPGGAGNFLSVNALGTGASSGVEINNIAIWPGLNTVYVFQKPAVGPPVANFIASNTTPGAGDNVTLIDQSVANPSITNWEWTITPATFTFVTGNQNSQNPVVAFQLGTYTVKLKVTNPNGSDSITKVNYITVSGYCTAGATNSADTDIGYFTFDSFSNGSGATPVTNNPNATGTYSNFTNLGPIQVNVNGSYPMTVSHITSGSTFYNAYIKVFIDYNQNGIFEVPSEVVLEGGTTQTAATLSGTVNIPPTAQLGLTRLRVVQREGGNTSNTTPCGTFSWGEVEDYTVEILASQPCNNPPVAGTATATPNIVYPNEPVYFDLTGYSGNVQWQYSTDGVNFTNITGATSVPDTLYANAIDTFYVRAWVTTNNCPPDSSNIVTVYVIPRTGDLPTNPKVISTNFYSDTDSTYGYTNNYTGPNNQAANDIFYQYIVPSCIDSININTCLTAFDSYIHVLRNGTHVISDDDGCGGMGGGSKIVLNNTQYSAGDTLLIVVEGYSAGQGTYTLSFNAYSSAPNAPLTQNDTICENTSATLNAVGSGTLYWYDVPTGGTPIDSGSTFITPILTSNTNYFVEAVVGNCTSSRSLIRVTVFSAPNAPVVQNDTICPGDSAILVAMSNVNVYWYDSIGGNIIGTGYTFITPPLANTTTYYAVAESGGCESSPVAVIAVVKNPGTVIPSVPDTVQVGQPFIVSATGGLTYYWNFGPVAVPDTAIGPGPHTVTMMMQGIYFITLKYTVECGMGMDSIVIPIVVEQSTSSIASNLFQSANVYPNPNHGTFSLKAFLSQNANVSFEIYNGLGQMVYQKSYQETSVINEVYPLNITSGVYTYKLVSSKGIFVGKFIVE